MSVQLPEEEYFEESPNMIRANLLDAMAWVSLLPDDGLCRGRIFDRLKSASDGFLALMRRNGIDLGESDRG